MQSTAKPFCPTASFARRRHEFPTPTPTHGPTAPRLALPVPPYALLPYASFARRSTQDVRHLLAALLWAVKAAGAVAGSAISLAYVLPRGRREAAIRFAVGVACGLVFGGAAGLKIADELAIGTRSGRGADADGLGRRQPLGLVGAGLPDAHAGARMRSRAARRSESG